MTVDQSGKTSASDAVRQELGRHPSGITALELASKTAEQGFSQRDVQREIRRAIDKGTVEVGGDLELRAAVKRP